MLQSPHHPCSPWLENTLCCHQPEDVHSIFSSVFLLFPLSALLTPAGDKCPVKSGGFRPAPSLPVRPGGTSLGTASSSAQRGAHTAKMERASAHGLVKGPRVGSPHLVPRLTSLCHLPVCGADSWWVWASISPIFFFVSLLNAYFLHLNLDSCTLSSVPGCAVFVLFTWLCSSVSCGE